MRLKLLLIALGVTAAFAGWAAYDFYRGPGPDNDTTALIERGDGLSRIARRLEANGIVVNRQIFMAGVLLYDAARDLKAGEYNIPAHSTPAQVLEILRVGRVVAHTITVAEGLSSRQIIHQITAHNDGLVGLIESLPAEGSLLPETYNYVRGDSRPDIITRMQTAMDLALASLWAGRDKGLPISTPHEAVTLASIVEKETGKASERAHIAGVFLNRLRRRMPLQSDPTIVYGITFGLPLGRPIRQSELDRVTAYNTYHFIGLPPTPIANPGRASMIAVLNPMATNDLYFVADGTGGHAFSATYRQHQANVRMWRKVNKRP